MINLNACNKTLTDDFHLWGKAICLNNQEKKYVSDKNLDYYIKHNEMLGVKNCNNLRK